MPDRQTPVFLSLILEVAAGTWPLSVALSQSPSLARILEGWGLCW